MPGNPGSQHGSQQGTFVLECPLHFIFLIKIFFIAIQLQLSAFSPHPSTPPQPIPPPSPTSPLLLDYVLVSIIVAPVDPSPHYPLLTPLWLLTLFLISMSLFIFCLLFAFVDYVPVKGEIIWHLSLTTWLISLSIMLSSSTHAVAKGISSFFLSGWHFRKGFASSSANKRMRVRKKSQILQVTLPYTFLLRKSQIGKLAIVSSEQWIAPPLTSLNKVTWWLFLTSKAASFFALICSDK